MRGTNAPNSTKLPFPPQSLDQHGNMVPSTSNLRPVCGGSAGIEIYTAVPSIISSKPCVFVSRRVDRRLLAPWEAGDEREGRNSSSGPCESRIRVLPVRRRQLRGHRLCQTHHLQARFVLGAVFSCRCDLIVVCSLLCLLVLMINDAGDTSCFAEADVAKVGTAKGGRIVARM